MYTLCLNWGGTWGMIFHHFFEGELRSSSFVIWKGKQFCHFFLRQDAVQCTSHPVARWNSLKGNISVEPRATPPSLVRWWERPFHHLFVYNLSTEHTVMRSFASLLNCYDFRWLNVQHQILLFSFFLLMCIFVYFLNPEMTGIDFFNPEIPGITKWRRDWTP